MRLYGAVAALVGVLVLGPGAARALRALMIFPFAAHSHNTMFRGMAEALVDRGHEVVMFSPFPRKNPRANYTDIDTSAGSKSLVGIVSFDLIRRPPFEPPGLLPYLYIKTINDMSGDSLCRHVFAMPEMQRLLAGGYGPFDVVLTEAFSTDCFAAIPHRLQLPVISLSSGPDWPWIHERMGSIDNPSYLVNVFTNLTEPMTFWNRVYNTVFTTTINYFYKRTLQDGSDATVREFFGDDVPPLRELVKNTSLILLNRHVSINSARPVPPNIVHVGGLHIQPPPNELDPSLHQFMDGAEHGVIYFSLGSMVKASTMPTAMREALLHAFRHVPQRVVWKWEEGALDLPANVRTAKWLPQMDVLTHPKTVLFMTHGGLMGTLEALYCGVPMLGIPLYADQGVNMDMYAALGVAERIDRYVMTNESTLQAVRTMTRDKRYQVKAREVAHFFRDRPQQAADEAVWWTEYVVRHRGAPHLRPRSADMPLYQYLLLDVLAFLLACGLACAFVAALLLRRLAVVLMTRIDRAVVKAKKVA